MKKYNWIKYFVYTIILLSYIMWTNHLLIFLNEKSQITFNPIFLIGWSILIFVILGVLLGLEKWLVERKKRGVWKVNLPKIIMLGIPSLYFSLSIFIYYCPISFIRNTLSYPVSVFLTNSISYIFIPIFQMILGYVIATSLYKIDINEYNLYKPIKKNHLS